MKKLLTLIIVMMTTFLLADSFTVDYDFAYPKFENDGEYDLIKLKDCLIMGEEGTPILPWKAIDLLLPQGQEVREINILNVEYYDHKTNVNLKPASSPVPISVKQSYVSNTIPNPTIYNSSEIYPTSMMTQVYTNYLAGHSIASFSFCPIQYIPAKKQLESIKNIRLEIVTQIGSRNDVRSAKTNEEIENRLFAIVDNPEMLSLYNYNENQRNDDYDILLISSSELLPEFEDYITFKQSTGWIVKAITTTEIYENYTGSDNPDRIRNCIIDYYENNNLGYVILGGDTESNPGQIVVPHRAFNVLDDPTMPSDIYFACLDGDWDSNNNGSYGESGEIDPYAEVYVGRICVDSAVEIQNFTNKLRMYQEYPVIEDVEKVLMIGEILNEDPWTYGGDYKDQISTGGMFDGYSTEGISSNMNIETLYERDYIWSTSELYTKFNTTGVHLLNHLGHSSPTYNMKMSNSDINSVNIHNNGIDHGYAIGYSQGCYNGSFDNWHFSGYYTEDCFAEKITTHEYGEVACIANSRYGWYMPGGTNSSSQYYDRQFFNTIFSDNHFLIGNVNHLSKEVNVSYAQNDEYYRWVYYETNLFGDPTLDIWTAIPDDFTPEYMAAIPIGSNEISVSCGVANARIALEQEGQLIGREVTDESGTVLIEFFDPISTVSPITLSIIGHNKNRYLSTIYVSADQPYIVQNEVVINDNGNMNGVPEYSETVVLDVGFLNLGQQNGVELNATLTSDDEFITIINNQCSLGSIAAGDSTTVNAAFSFSIADYIPDNHSTHFIINVTDSNGEAGMSFFDITLSAPDLTSGDIAIVDYIGDHNGNLDPGETATFTFPITNNGSADSPELNASLDVDNDLVTIELTSEDLDVIEAGETKYLIFTISASDQMEEGVPVILNLIVSSNTIAEYGFEQNYTHIIGFIYDSFESGDFSSYQWTNSGDANWQVTTENPYEGLYCAKTGTIGSNGITSLNLELDILIESDMIFYVKVSSENNCDFLAFSVDGTIRQQWSGEMGWTEETQTLSSGHHVLSWSYKKDQYSSDGSDCAWLDFVVMPVISGLDPAQVQVDQTEFEYNVNQVTPISEILTITNTGESDLHYEVMADFLNLRGHGGPDNYGYQWYDSNVFNGPEFNWIERPDDANEVTFVQNDQASSTINMQFDFSFYGTNYNNLIINPNGWIGFGDDNESWQNMNLPNSDSPKPAICAFWDDLRPFDGTDGGGYVYYQSYQDSFIVWFENIEHYSGDNNGTYEFQIILKSNGDVILQYNTLEGDLDSATIGIQNATGTDGLQIANNQEYLEEGLAIIIRKLESWIYINGNSGVIPMGESSTVNFVIIPAGLESGLHTCSLLINSNDPVNPIYSIPVTLEILSTGSEEYDVPSVTELKGNYPNPFNPTTRIAFSVSSEDLDKEALLSIYNLKGQKVKSYQFSPNSLNNYNEVIWNGKDANSNSVSSGVYFYRLDTYSKKISSKMILMK